MFRGLVSGREGSLDSEWVYICQPRMLTIACVLVHSLFIVTKTLHTNLSLSELYVRIPEEISLIFVLLQVLAKLRCISHACYLLIVNKCNR